MKRLFVALVLAIASMGASAPVDSMYANCVEQMKRGSCIALADPGTFTEEQKARRVYLGKTEVTWGDFLAVRGIGSVDPTDIRMCEVAKQFCDQDENDNRCKVGKALWGS